MGLSALDKSGPKTTKLAKNNIFSSLIIFVKIDLAVLVKTYKIYHLVRQINFGQQQTMDNAPEQKCT